LINRMTGHAADAPQVQTRQQPQVTGYEEEHTPADPEAERIEIPAFLRRQAN
jgi:cell division protein FtsZ